VDEQGRVETVRLADNAFSLASAIYFAGDNEVIVGNEALEYRVIHPDRVVRRFKREMGNPKWHFSVDEKTYRAEQLSALVLRKLVNDAAKRIGPIHEAVISVPFIFDNARRQATKDAGKIAGIHVLDIIDEPVAGALAYANKIMQAGGDDAWEMQEFFGDRIILVYDLGGGTFDLTLMKVKSDYTYEVIATNGDPRLGGEDWDDVLEKMLVMQYMLVHGENPAAEPGTMQDIRSKAVQAKHTLSESPRAIVELVKGEESKKVVVLQADFMRESEPLVFRTEMILHEMMNGAKMPMSSVESVLAIGGSSRMPMIQSRLENLTKRKLDMSLSPDTAVSQGAALFAAYRKGHAKLKKIRVRTVNPHALGLMVYSRSQEKHVNKVQIHANQPTMMRSKRVYPVAKGATEINLVVLQGEAESPEDCVVLMNKPLPLPAHEALDGARVVVAFSFQENGLLLVEAELHSADGHTVVPVRFDVVVEGSMSAQEVEAAGEVLTGITIG
jgi:molecular chaperone DnaK